ncbi:MAG: DUF167 domain-containing protein [bacterium]|nr:DUF167 domain-containing protein [bacterium]
MDKEFDSYRHDLAQEGMVYLNVKVIPKAQKTELAGVLIGAEGEEVLKIKVVAVPEKGKANKALCDYLAKVFGVSKSQVSVVRGQTSQRKVVKARSLGK